MRRSKTNNHSVSQFTLLAKTSKGTKPDFHGALGGEEAKRLYHYFLDKVKESYVVDRVKDGRFQAMMEVALVNDGPVSAATSTFRCWWSLTG
jgi:D-aminoacyl-tRNA deacylase